MKKYTIDFFLIKTDLLIIFSELIKQFNFKDKTKYLNFRKIDHIDNNKLSLISIFDNVSINQLNVDMVSFDQHIIIIGYISQPMLNTLIKKNINFEQILPPINVLNIIAKIKSLVIQYINISSQLIAFKNFKYSYRLNTIYVNNFSLYLTDKENEIFQTLIFHIKKPIDKKKLLVKVWNYNKDIDTHTLETHIYTLRKKIEEKLYIKDMIKHLDDGYFINKNYL
tara:strand:- start:258 stop:929 length:672 start_codon:yes stop_codon:yes gene_type:complete